MLAEVVQRPIPEKKVRQRDCNFKMVGISAKPLEGVRLIVSFLKGTTHNFWIPPMDCSCFLNLNRFILCIVGAKLNQLSPDILSYLLL